MSRVKSHYRHRGFTILEIMVVVAVISIITSTILLNTSFKRPENELKEYAGRLQKTLRLLTQEAILDDKNYALSVIPGGYVILEYNGQEWLPSEDRFLQKLSQTHTFEETVTIDNTEINIEKTDEPQPHILVLSSGEMTPFEWVVEDPETDFQVKLTSNLLGDIVIEGPSTSL
jgi:general secretion pathway protein H